MLKLGIFGHSSACWQGSNRESFVDILRDEFDVVCRGVPQGSEERALFELKKNADCDVVVIFHSSPRYLYLPMCNRDISIKQISGAKADVLWRENTDGEPSSEEFDQEFFSYGKIKEVFGERDQFVNTMNLYKKFLYSDQKASNIFAGSMLLIDSFILRMEMKAIHCVTWKPDWLEFQSGVVCTELQEMISIYRDETYPNNISLEGNRLMAEKIREIVRGFDLPPNHKSIT